MEITQHWVEKDLALTPPAAPYKFAPGKERSAEEVDHGDDGTTINTTGGGSATTFIPTEPESSHAAFELQSNDEVNRLTTRTPSPTLGSGEGAPGDHGRARRSLSIGDFMASCIEVASEEEADDIASFLAPD